ncbi:hypothetical protein CLV84_0239 [Neolewinella xylanilytica]|uniref:Uncharacterized protein n=1 Tax=Neolewinella xylanilytica TaxID=1514080 RepID=A0A2S6I722_9BACT|nr:hypothetical protein [Neolewinella xylanilytica]PPK87301.1 hypothetical protein CLV84_0239 [Neolewinella xylanilytica]
MKLAIIAAFLLTCARQSLPDVGIRSEITALVTVVLTDYSSDACLSPAALMVPEMPVPHFTEAGLDAATAEAVVAGIARQTPHNWKSVLADDTDDQGNCLSVSYPILYDGGEFAYVFVANGYGQADYLYRRVGSSWELYRMISQSIH